MIKKILHKLADDHPDNNVFYWQGVCHDCGDKSKVTLTMIEEGFKIEGGAVYYPFCNDENTWKESETFFLKCEKCFKKDGILKNYQDCEVYQRVVGYLRPMSNWNDAKLAESENRKTFNLQ